MKLIAETHDAQYNLQVMTNTGEILATASLESGAPAHVGSRFYIWEGAGPCGEDEEEYEGQNAVQRWTVKEGQTPDALWEQIVEFETYRVAMAVWQKRRDQEAREGRFIANIKKAEDLLTSIERSISLHFEVDRESIDDAVSQMLTSLVSKLQAAVELCENMAEHG